MYIPGYDFHINNGLNLATVSRLGLDSNVPKIFIIHINFSLANTLPVRWVHSVYAKLSKPLIFTNKYNVTWSRPKFLIISFSSSFGSDFSIFSFVFSPKWYYISLVWFYFDEKRRYFLKKYNSAPKILIYQITFGSQ